MRLPHLPIALLAFASLACSDSDAPPLEGPSYFTITLDGQAWTPDTVTGVFYFVTPDSGTLNLFAARVDQTSEETVALSFRLPLSSRVLQLSDTASPAVGTYTVGPRFSLPPARPLLFASTRTEPGVLRISGFSASDTVVAGTFAFRAVATPDTAGHRAIAGQFRVRYFTQQVYIPVR